jgi:hypothetical protein
LRALCWAISSPLLLASCSGGGDGPIGAVQAQTPPAPVEVAQIHAVLRPDATGKWFVQDDKDHAPIGVVEVTEVDGRLVLRFDRQYTHAGTVQVSTDDGFNDQLSAHASLGVTATFISLYVRGVKIQPHDVLAYIPGAAGDGNLWVDVTMLNKR